MGGFCITKINYAVLISYAKRISDIDHERVALMREYVNELKFNSRPPPPPFVARQVRSRRTSVNIQIASHMINTEGRD